VRLMVREEALLWFKQGEHDLRKAYNDLITQDWDSAAFWSQQAAEKVLKALLLNAGITFRGHNLLEIAEVIEKELRLDVKELMNDLRELTTHYIISRYPNAANALPYQLYTYDKAKDLVERDRRVVEWVRQYLR